MQDMNFQEKMVITIEPAKETDCEELYTIFGDWDKTQAFSKELFVSTFHLILQDTHNSLLIARDERQILGFVQIVKSMQLGLEPYYEVAELLIKEAERGKGIGKRLLARAEAFAIEHNVYETKLCSQVHRSRAHVFYENNGYEFCKISQFYEKNLRKP